MSQTLTHASPPRAWSRGAEATSSISLRNSILAGFLVLAITFGGFGTWATLAPLSSAVIAEGVFIVSSQRKEIQHPEGGVVREILVEEGQWVASGQILARLEDTQAQTTLDTLSVAYDEARARVARLDAERSLRNAIRFPEDLVQRRGEDAEIDALLRHEEAFFRARQQALSGTIAIVRGKIEQLKQQISGVEAQLGANNREASFSREELSGLRSLFEDGLVEKSRVLVLEREVARLEGEVGVNIAEGARLAAEMAEEELQVIQAYSDMREQVIEEMREANTMLAGLRARMRDAEYTLANTIIRAPQAGTIMELSVHTLGGVIGAGQSLLQLVPDSDALVVEARIAPTDVEVLMLGQQARVQLTGLPNRAAVDVEGEVVYLSADRVTDERSGQSHYVVRIAVDPESLAALDDRRLMAGMPARVILAAGERTALGYLTQPLLEGVQRAWREE